MQQQGHNATFCQGGKEEFKAWCQGVGASVTSVDITAIPFCVEQAKALCALLQENKKITRVSVEVSDACDGVGVLCKELEGLCNVNDLEVAYAYSCPDVFLDLLQKNQSVQRLQLFSMISQESYFGVPQIMRLVHSIQLNELSVLRKLRLPWNNLQHEAGTLLGEFLATRECPLEELDLSFNPALFGGSAVSTLANALMVNQRLTCLSLERTSIGPGGAILLANALKVNKTLRMLNVSSNELKKEGVSSLAESLCINRTLRHLDVGYNDFYDVDFFLKPMSINTSLKSLNLSGMCSSGPWVNDIGEMIRQNSSLQKLHLDDCDWHIARWEPIAEALLTNGTLTVCPSTYDSEPVCIRNRERRKRVKKNVVVFLAIAWWRKRLAPKEIIQIIAKLLWKMRIKRGKIALKDP